jgi:hypothetical protein
MKKFRKTFSEMEKPLNVGEICKEKKGEKREYY